MKLNIFFLAKQIVIKEVWQNPDMSHAWKTTTSFIWQPVQGVCGNLLVPFHTTNINFSTEKQEFGKIEWNNDRALYTTFYHLLFQGN